MALPLGGFTPITVVQVPSFKRQPARSLIIARGGSVLSDGKGGQTNGGSKRSLRANQDMQIKHESQKNDNQNSGQQDTVKHNGNLQNAAPIINLMAADGGWKGSDGSGSRHH